MDTMNWRTDDKNTHLISQINWPALVEYALNLRANRCMETISTGTCHIHPSYHMGGLHLVRALEFGDGAKWIARIQQHQSTSSSEKRLLHEVATLSLLRSRTSVPVPEVFAHETNSNIIGRPFMIMELIPGSTAMDAFGGWKVHRGKIPANYKPDFSRSIAEIQVAMTEIRFPRIGRIIRRDDGSYDIDAIPGLGGPFDTASDYFVAWSNTIKHPMKESKVRACSPGHLCDELLRSHKDFPQKIKANLPKMIVRNEGPFPLFHPDFRHSNVIIGSDYEILSVIDWENAGTVPWEVVEFPLFLSDVPQPMDAPTNYDAEGNPIDEETRVLRKERKGYVQSVREIEKEKGSDNSLSTILASSNVQNIATALRLYEDGKVGFYCKILDAL